MGSQALEILERLGGEPVRYISKITGPKILTAFVDPMRRTDDLGQQAFLTKTYEVYLVKDQLEGMDAIYINADQIAVRLQPCDREETLLKITKIYPERDSGMPGDGVGMWHLEAVA